MLNITSRALHKDQICTDIRISTLVPKTEQWERGGLICSQRISRYDRPAGQTGCRAEPFTSNLVFFASPINSIYPQSMQMWALTQTSADLADRNFAFLGRKHTLPLDCIEPGSRFAPPHLRHFFSSFIIYPSSNIFQISSVLIHYFNRNSFKILDSADNFRCFLFRSFLCVALLRFL